MRKLEYDPNSVLYYSKHDRDTEGRHILIGSDPGLADLTKLFRWRDAANGWENREAWTSGIVELVAIPNPAGARSGWPGAIPLGPRPPGRPRKDVPIKDQLVKVATSLRRAELFEIMRLAAEDQQSVAEWVATTLRDRLGQVGKRTAP